VDYHAGGMEQGHIQSVKEAFKFIRPANFLRNADDTCKLLHGKQRKPFMA